MLTFYIIHLVNKSRCIIPELQQCQHKLEHLFHFYTLHFPFSIFHFQFLHSPFSIFNFPFSIFHFQFSIFNFPFSIFHFQFSIFNFYTLHFPFSIFHFQFSILSEPYRGQRQIKSSRPVRCIVQPPCESKFEELEYIAHCYSGFGINSF
jgi:hypothetical protein